MCTGGRGIPLHCPEAADGQLSAPEGCTQIHGEPIQDDLLVKLCCTEKSDLQHPALLLSSGFESAKLWPSQVYGKDGVFDADRLIDLLSAFEDYSVASKSAQGECHVLQQHTQVCLILALSWSCTLCP